MVIKKAYREGDVRAVRFLRYGGGPEVVKVPTPVPHDGEVLLQVLAAGLCHTDIFLMSQDEGQSIYAAPPLTLGHEGVGTVVELGPEAVGVDVGDVVAVYPPWGCGQCYDCAVGDEHHCTKARASGIGTPGLTTNGALAEYLLVDSPRHLVSIGGLDPVDAAPLTDAGLTPYHVIKASLAKFTPGSVAVVIGVGGLGHLAVQMLKVLSPAIVVALDVDDAKLELARNLGADVAMLSSDHDLRSRIADLSHGRMATAVFDFAGSQSSLDIARTLVGVGGDLRLIGVGLGGAFTKAGFGYMPFDSTIGVSTWGSRRDLFEVIELADRGLIQVNSQRFSLDEAPFAYEKLRLGELLGRAVVVPCASH